MNSPQHDEGAMRRLAGPRATDSDATSEIPAELGTPYQKGYEDGFLRGRTVGYREGYAEGRNRPQQNHAKPQAASAPPANTSVGRRWLFGLPCERCGRFLYSNEIQCPHCKPATAHRSLLLQSSPVGSVAGDN